MKKLLIFLDIDGTLIKPNQQPNTRKLPSVIQKLASKGVLFGLNSNRSFEDIMPIYRQFGLNGPIILENGVYFLKSPDSRRTFLVQKPKLLHRTSAQAIRAFIRERSLACQFDHTDTVKIVKSKKLKTAPLGIFLNGFRKYTGSVHIYRYGKRDFQLAKDLRTFLKKYFAKKGLDLLVESPKAFGNVVFWPRGANKGKALRKIKKYYPNYDFFMVGDDLADLETCQEIQGFFAVGNAQSKVKKAADYIAHEAYTKGVVEILNYIEQKLFSNTQQAPKK